MKPWALLLPVLLYEARGLRDSRAQQQQQNVFNIVGDTADFTSRHRRSVVADRVSDAGWENYKTVP